MQDFIKTRSSAQIRSHAQKFFNQIKKKGGKVIIKDHKPSKSNNINGSERGQTGLGPRAVRANSMGAAGSKGL